VKSSQSRLRLQLLWTLDVARQLWLEFVGRNLHLGLEPLSIHRRTASARKAAAAAFQTWLEREAA
jgi:hypothetical protein